MRMFDNLLFSKQGIDRYPRLSSHEVDYWQTIFRKILKVGEEFELQSPQNRSLDSIIDELYGEFRPTGSVTHHGAYGVKEVTTDGSVPHGVEIITVGKRFDWKTFKDMNSRLINAFHEKQLYSSNHTGMHIHLLAGYSGGTSELEKDVPSIILANLYQLHRLFAPELYWLASAGANDYARTRYIFFRRPPFEFSAVAKHIASIKGEMEERHGKYQMFNMNPVRFGHDSNHINRFHVEVRYPDTILSPSYATALVSLEVALLYKAISLSQCGTLSLKQDEFNFKKELFDKFVNLGTGDRESDSTELTDSDIDNLTIRSSSLIRWLKPELANISQSAYDILKSIAEKPACEMRIKGMSWNQIEEKIYTPRVMDNENMSKLLEIIVLQQLTDFKNEEEWIEEATNRLEIPLDKAKSLLGDIRTEKLLKFDEELGGMMLQNIV